MRVSFFSTAQKLAMFTGLILVQIGICPVIAEPAPAAAAAFERYTAAIEGRLEIQHRSAATFLSPFSTEHEDAVSRLRRGELILEHIEPTSSTRTDGALLHDWRGTAFAPGARTADFLRLMQDYEHYPQHYAPQVEQARTLTHKGDLFHASVRIRQKHVITVVMDTEYDIQFGQLDAQHGYTVSRSTRISEIASPGTSAEHVFNAKEEHGFLWRLNTYWSCEERDGGLYMQIEAVSLTRAIPTGLGWAVRPYVESIPRESLEFTLRSTMNALRR